MNAILETRLDLSALTRVSPLRPEDYSELREMHKHAVNATGWRYYSLHEVEAKLREIDDGDYSLRMLAENGLAARIGRTLVASAHWEERDDDVGSALITDVYTHPLFERGGIGTKLVQIIEQSVYDRGFKRLTVRSNLNSRGFFAKLGYEPEGFEIYRIQAKTEFPMQTMSRSIM